MDRVETGTGSYTEYVDYSNTSSAGAAVANRPACSKTKITNRATEPVAASKPVNLVLKDLPSQMLERMRPHLRTVFLAKEQFLFQQDDRIEYVYFPETAVISELRILEDGRMVEIAITGKEGAAGLSAVCCSSKLANCTQVSQAGSALRIETAVLLRITRQIPELSFQFHKHIEQYIRQISQRAVCNMYHSVEQRFCTWLLMLQDRCGKSELKLTHEQIARTLGVYRPSVTWIAVELRKKKMINYSRGVVAIHDRDKIEDAACGCYFELNP